MAKTYFLDINFGNAAAVYNSFKAGLEQFVQDKTELEGKVSTIRRKGKGLNFTFREKVKADILDDRNALV